MQDCKEPDIWSVTTTVSSLADAKALAREILSQRLAACVQIDPGLTSLYRWNGTLCEEPEVRLVIKSLPACEPALLALFASHHPYEVPQFLVAPMRASGAYGQWARAEMTVPPG
ncbi:MAG: periplasmic divalent cation tolerance protein-like protein [Ramlibacter sp.]|nr:periplasmic divalent cation tolerance protein-like protein [Ramlibacter sp.]